ncbi:hypothetical protein [Flammeovirga aprica]|uniref:Uncharacterized protein n=1 Tax=Flammeovirga aprica JL-4 TaxID=694437 RepID=A0A7X9RTD9_9BACT|nr:hypothetical protein [Flammeovirga aprica]NME67189.1 hypothetical protein [Flammeovirga aprica JL-4]
MKTGENLFNQLSDHDFIAVESEMNDIVHAVYKDNTDPSIQGQSREKDATIKIELKAESGFKSSDEAKISPYQWSMINKIIHTQEEYILVQNYF